MSEAKQLPRLAIAGPMMGARDKKTAMGYRIGNVVPAILPMYSPKTFQRPGDVYRPLSKSSSRHSPRPLGLIPERQDHSANSLLTRYSRTLFSQPSKFKQEEESDYRGNKHDTTKPNTAVSTTRLKPLNVQYRAKSAITFGENVQSITTVPSTLYEETDPDYMDMFDRLNVPSLPSHPRNSPEHALADIYTHEYNHSSYQNQRHSVSLPVKPSKPKKSNKPRRRAHSLRPHSETADSTIEYQQHSGHTSTARYFNFVEQASLNHRNFDTDKRDGMEYIPCERCRLRGGRCSNCKTIRVGGGYIVLDGDGDDDNMKRGFGHLNDDSQVSISHFPSLTDTNNQGAENLSNKRGLLSKSNLLQQDQGNNKDGGKGNCSSGNLDGNNKWGRSINDHNSGNNDMSGSKVGLSQNRSNTNLGANRSSSSGLDSSGSNMGRIGLSQGGGDMDTTDQTRSRPGSSRPMSSRPMSSRNRVGSGIGNRQSFEGKNRKGGTSTSVDKSHGGRRKKKSGDDDSDDGSSDDDDDDEKRRRRKKKDSNNLPDIDEHDKTKKKKKKQVKDFNLHGKYGDEDSEPEQGLRYTGSLHKFKSKEDNVKALKCTLKELQGIDPLDYLAKYCIIDQSKVPNYQRVYDNVDRDEDDEIDISELDFALKAVNYDLISDAEVDYVNQILELSSRYKLNFHLFSVIAALSEKVVALEDMVKKLINKMDLKALETKMKKCKELFYLLDDMDSGERDGVVTIGSLAVELQAGGLTEEHVEFVVDRLNHDKKGLVEFLDYLTYVPLFVEIHDSVCGNPLDFTRTK